ncbi:MULTISPECIES: MalY/PatB family protein [Streptomyces]|uniref:MalY/PatB family protein n=1 Tax=Streptomyces TaxID=1883 RepID=UPI000CD4D9DC|nr:MULTISPECIES: aminotransferase class I/II-fold pyridoxal phosphate-dependent enzyme [Streptomyces]
MAPEHTGPPNPLTQLTEAQLRRRTSIKWNWYEPDVLPAWVAEMDVPVAEPVVAALTDALALGDTGYPTGTGYAEALAGFAAARWGWTVEPERTAIVPDVMLGLVELLKLVTGPGDTVVISPPVYPPIRQFSENIGRRVTTAPLDGGGRLDPAALDRAFAAATAGGARAAYVLCSPHNPTGTVHTAAELATLAALADEHGVRVVSDEIHAPLVLPGAVFVPYLAVPGTERGFAVHSASKGWHLSGAKAGLAVAGAEAAAELARLPEEVAHGRSHLGVISHTAALRDGGPWLDALLAGLAQNRDLLAGLLGDLLPEVRWRPQQGGYLAWLDCRQLGLGDDPAAVFLDRGRLAVNPGATFGEEGAGHVRLNTATPPELLTEAVRRMATAARARA